MNKKPHYIANILGSFLLLISLIAQAAEGFNVVVSSKPVHSIVAGLMKDIGFPELLISGSQSPYDFAISQMQKDTLNKAQLFIWVGPELEVTLNDVVKQLSDSVHVVEVLDSPHLKILPSRQHPDQRDPFFWMDDRNVIILLDDITEILIQLDPARSHIYARNRRAMLIHLKRIDREYEYGYRGMKAGLGVQYVDTLQYFEQAYALNIIAQVKASPLETEPVDALLNARKKTSSDEVVCLLIDKAMPIDDPEILTSGKKINIGEMDVLGTQLKAGPELYINLMTYNIDVIKTCLNADMGEAASARQTAEQDDIPDMDGIRGRFILQNQFAQTVTEEDMKGHYSLVFFGYTSCPDICPTSLTTLTQALKQMGDKALKVQPYFISVDPKRDSLKTLREYVAYFDPRLIGLTGQKDMIKRVADQFKAKYEIVETDSQDSNMYTIDHTASLYLMAPDGTFVTKFANSISASTLAEELTKIIH